MHYKLQHQIDANIVGKDFPQVECLTQAYAHSLDAWTFPNFAPKLIFNLAKRAKLTDVLLNAAISANGLLINEKVKNLLSNFKLLNHKFYEVTIFNKNESLKYYWLHICEPKIINSVDYQKSIFYRTQYTFREEIIKLTSYQEYEDLKSKDEDAAFGVELDEIFLTNAFNSNLDLFTFLPFDNNLYISETLKEAFENDNVTGIEYEEAHNLNI